MAYFPLPHTCVVFTFSCEMVTEDCIHFQLSILLLLLLLLYISGNETKDASKAHLSTVARKAEETCKQERFLCEPETPG